MSKDAITVIAAIVGGILGGIACHYISEALMDNSNPHGSDANGTILTICVLASGWLFNRIAASVFDDKEKINQLEEKIRDIEWDRNKEARTIAEYRRHLETVTYEDGELLTEADKERMMKNFVKDD